MQLEEWLTITVTQGGARTETSLEMPPVDRKRADFVERVGHAIKTSPHLVRKDLNVEVDTRHVTLTGTVESYFQKQIAQEVVRRVDGVESIDNRLEVAWSRNPKKSQPAAR